MRQARTITAALLLACTAHVAAQTGAVRPAGGSAPQGKPQRTLPLLKVHPEGRYLVKQDGTPFLYLCDWVLVLDDAAKKSPAPGWLVPGPPPAP